MLQRPSAKTFLRRTRTSSIAVAAVLSLLLAGTRAASADPVEDFYRGKTISLIMGTSAGNDYDFRGRLLARHLSRYIPGHPTIVPRNMPGAGGIIAANYLAALAPRDGTTLHMIMANMMSAQAMKSPGIEFDTRKFSWIGNTTSSPNVLTTWAASGVKTIEDARLRSASLGAPTGTSGVLYAELLNAVAGTKFKIVTGYPGGNEVNLAMERGEVDGRGSIAWASWKATKPDWVATGKLNYLVQVALKRDPELAQVPLLLDFAKNDEDRAVLHFLSADTAVARSLVTTADVPPERVAALRRAFDAVVKDAEFLADADKTKMDISPTAGEDAQKIADSIADTPDSVIARARSILGDLLK
ncbi:MAG: Tripartite-type tricarboxylate transporter, receptor component TctC [Hyphomicrobiales bacterium]|nr:Tripartite-type tricarboxylate transporter, receptor component TctC [Hyphomicrobiales bacterium]